MIRTRKRNQLLLFFCSFCLLFLSGLAVAKITWEYHRSITGAFDVRFPAEYKIKSIPLRIDDKTVLFRSEIVSETDEEAEPKDRKSFMVKVDQSFGGPMPYSTVTKLMDRDVRKYKKMAAAGNGFVEDIADFKEAGFPGKTMLISFGKGEKGQSIRAKIVYTDISRIEMVLTGPAGSMYAFKANDFFNSLKPYDGSSTIEGTPGEGWTQYESPLGLYTLTLPPVANTFGSGKPRFSVDGSKEIGRYVLRDPVLGYRAFFNFYGYKMKEDMKFDAIKIMLYSQHISKFSNLLRLQDIEIDNKLSKDGKYGIATTVISMPPLDDYPYIDAVLLQALFNKEGVLVMEFMGTKGTIKSNLGKTLFSLVEFHPERAYEPGAENKDRSEYLDTGDTLNSEKHPDETDEEDLPLEDSKENAQGATSPDKNKETDPSKSSDADANAEDKQSLKAKITLGNPSSSAPESEEDGTPPDGAAPENEKQVPPPSDSKAPDASQAQESETVPDMSPPADSAKTPSQTPQAEENKVTP